MGVEIKEYLLEKYVTEIYCDESRQDLLVMPSHENQIGSYALIGSLWLDSTVRSDLTTKIKELRKKHNTYGEIKWSKVLSPNRKEFFVDLIRLFFDEEVRFRCICIEANRVNNVRFNDGDSELGFYKFYFQTLYHWIKDDTYRIFCDYKINYNRNRLNDLHRTLKYKTRGDIEFVQALSSTDTPMLQFCDFLLGLTSAAINRSVLTGTIKAELIGVFESYLGRPIGPTSKSESKYNIFFIDLKD